MMSRIKFLPLIVAGPLFLQNIDTTSISVALPSIAHTLGVPTLHVNLAITAYLLSLAVFLPLSGWVSDRIGAKNVFCLAIAFFSIGSALCGLANTLPQLVLFRIVQGLGGALMLPVGRLILLQIIPTSEMVTAMVWYTVPSLIGRMLGPLLGGIIITWSSWRWIFLINIPLGFIYIYLAWKYVDDLKVEGRSEPFDIYGFLLLSFGLTLLMASFETAGKSVLPIEVVLGGGLAGIVFLYIYAMYGRTKQFPIIDLNLLKTRTYRTNFIGGIPLRVAIGASPFLLPLMLQIGFGLSPLTTGSLMLATSIGGLSTRVVMKRAILEIGFRKLLICATTLTGFSYLSYSMFGPETSHEVIFLFLILGGLLNSLSMVTLATLGFSDISKERMSHATALGTMIQQLSISFGVVLAAAVVSLSSRLRGGDAGHLLARDFSPAFALIGLLTLISVYSFYKLSPNDGDEMR